MRGLPITGVLLAAALAACGSVDDRGGCTSSTDCPVGQYCAHTGDGNVCWADAVAPRVSGVTVACLDPVAVGSTCPRDGVLHVEATVTDDKEVLGVDAVLDVGGAPVPLARAGGNLWAADVQLGKVPFDYFEHQVVTTVVARDGARNAAAGGAAGTTTVTVTRNLWKTSLGAGLSSPAVGPTGILAVPANNGRVHFLTWDGTYIGSVDLAVSTPQAITAPSFIGDSFWVGAEDGRVYELSQTGGNWTATSRANTGGAVRGSLGVAGGGSIIAASSSGFVYAVTSAGAMNSSPGYATTLGTVLDSEDSIFLVSGGIVRRFTLVLGAPTLDTGFAASVGAAVETPLACTQQIMVGANGGTGGVVKRVDTKTAAIDPVATTTGAPSSGIAIDSDGSILVPEQTTLVISRWAAAGIPFPGWQAPPLDSEPRTPLIVSGAAARYVTSTAGGFVHALADDGSVTWSARFGTASLQPGNIYTPPGQAPGEERSIAYFAGSDGVLHAVLVDGTLDASAPWPKAFHDPRNTNRAGAQP